MSAEFHWNVCTWRMLTEAQPNMVVSRSTPLERFHSRLEEEGVLNLDRLNENSCFTVCTDEGFNPTTVSHTVVFHNLPLALQFWKDTLQFMWLLSSNATAATARRASQPNITAAFAARGIDDCVYLIGIVTTNMTQNSPRSLISAWTTNPAVQTFVDVPIGKHQRDNGTLVLSWDHCTRRVTPHTILPAMHVEIVGFETCSPQEFPFSHVRVVRGRPADSELSGTCCVELRECGSVHFTDLTVSGEGEHLLIVETVVKPSYHAFVPPLSAHLKPFRVVPVFFG